MTRPADRLLREAASGPWDTVVVGAGPAGASAAYHLASRGRRVLLLEKRHFPRDKVCGDGLTQHAARLLAEMGVLDRLPGAYRVRGVRVFMRDRGQRDFLYPTGRTEHDYGMVLPRKILDEVICRRAVEAGAVLVEGATAEGLVELDGRFAGVEVRVGESSVQRIRASAVVAADGATSNLARHAGLSPVDPSGYGIAVRAYFDGIEGLDRLLEIHLPVVDATDNYLLPSYGWVFPTGPETANIGIGLFERHTDDNVQQIFSRFLDFLRETDERFATARQTGGIVGAPLRFDFAPERCAAPGLLLVGDAAGLISPFTGEGISYSLESGRTAAEVIDRCLRINPRMTSMVDDYRTLLEHRYAGYFELGRHSSRRYLLIWHVLDSRFKSEKPVFGICRRLVLAPEGTGEPIEDEVLDDVSALLPRCGLHVREDMLAVGSVLSASVRRDWPFLTRLSIADRGVGFVAFRPAILLLLSTYFGRPDCPRRAELGAAVELGYLSFLALSGVEEEAPETSEALPPVNWGNKFAILLSDFLLTKAYMLSGAAAVWTSDHIGRAVEASSAARINEIGHAYRLDLTEDDRLAIVAGKFGTLFELPCRLGAAWSGAPASTADALARFGRALGVAYALMEDVLTLAYPGDRTSSPFVSDLSTGIYGLPILRALRSEATGARLCTLLETRNARLTDVAALVAETEALESVRKTARAYAQRAQEALVGLPDSPARRGLESLAAYTVDRELPPKNDLEPLIGDGHSTPRGAS